MGGLGFRTLQIPFGGELARAMLYITDRYGAHVRMAPEELLEFA